MSDLSGLTTNYFATPKEGFTTTLASTISSGATTVPLNSITGYTNGAIATMVVEPTSVTAKQVFTGVVDTAGIQLTLVKWTEGTNQSHAAGSTVVDYVTATHMAALVKGLTTSALDQDGTLKAGAVDNSAALANAIVTVPKLTTELQKGWEDSYGTTTFPTPNTITYNGNGSYDCVYNSVDLTSAVSVGMRQKFTRTVTAPTQCTSLNGTTQYYSKTTPNGMTFTDDSTHVAWVKLNSYKLQAIHSRYTGGTGGFIFRTLATGQVSLFYETGGGLTKDVTSYQSIPLNKWVHIAASLDASGSSGLVYINGVLVPSTTTGSATALTQSGTFEIGRYSGSNYFDGKIAQDAVFSSVLSASTIRSYASQTYSGSESTLISAYSFNNSINDLNANANNLTANGSAVATNADSPFGQQADGTTAGTTEYAIITKTAFSTNTTITVQVPEGCALPTSGGISAVSYSTQKVPYGFPAQRGKWRIFSLYASQFAQTSPVAGTWYNFSPTSGTSLGAILTIPTGEWIYGYEAALHAARLSNASNLSAYITLSTANNTESDLDLTSRVYVSIASAVDGSIMNSVKREKELSTTASTSYYMNAKVDTASVGSISVYGSQAITKVYADNAYL